MRCGKALDAGERRRFMRHARPWWDVHRHRIAPQVAAQIAGMVGEGRLEIVAGRIGPMREVEGGIEVAIARRGRSASEVRTFAAAFNCTGPLGAIKRTRDPLLKQMLDDGLVAADELGMGLAVDERVARGRRRVGAWAADQGAPIGKSSRSPI